MEQVHRRLAQGARVKGYKVGLTNAAARGRFGADQPDYGHLFDDTFHLENQPIRADRYIAPLAEAEVAFVLGRHLAGPGVTVAEAAAAVDFVLPALEIVDCRVRDWKVGLTDMVADNANAAGVVLGSRPTRLSDVDLVLAGCNLYRNGEVVGTGTGAAVLGSPLHALVWLANAVGVPLSPGQVVMSGTITAAVPVAAGDTVTAAIAGLGSVSAHFVAAP
jgi:2-keto-4-pentenoate hydratase